MSSFSSGPFDVISQHLMLWGGQSRTNSTLNLNPDHVRRFGKARSVIRELYRVDGGLRAYYRGYTASVATYVPISAFWWMFYPVYSGHLVALLPPTTSHMLIHCTAGSLSGMTVVGECIRGSGKERIHSIY